jgi:acyl-coenzyme A synthetase/AMP-(fatty) acid ligase
MVSRMAAGTMGELWRQWQTVVERLPRRIVVIDAATAAKWTSRKLTVLALEKAEALARFRPGERIAFRLPNGADWLAVFLALQKAGLAAMPFDHALPDEGCRELARRLGAAALWLEGGLESLGASPRVRAICCIKVTSGTGAAPKAIACRAEHLLADGHAICRTMRLAPGDVNLGLIPFGHSYGLGNLVMPLLLQGTAVVCAGHYVPRQLLGWMRRFRVTVFPGVPALFRVLATVPREQGELSPLRTAISAGAPLTPSVAAAFHERFGVKIHNFYGSSETGGICYDRSGTASLSGRSVGRPLHGVAVQIKSGKVTVRSPAVASPRGRWQLDDRGEWNARGELVLLGRGGKGANIAGKKVHPLEVEMALRGLRDVTDAAVWLLQHAGRDLLAAVVETERSAREIEGALGERLPAWKLPKLLLVVREFPRNARGKVDLAALRRRVTLPAG